MVTVRRRPCEVALNERCYNHVQVVRAVFQICVVTSDEVAVEDHQLWRFCIEDLVLDIRRPDILLWAPLLPRICELLCHLHMYLAFGRTYSHRSANPRIC